MPPGESAAAVKSPFTLDTQIFPSGTNTLPSTLLIRGKGVGSSAHSDPTFVPQETQKCFTPGLVAATPFLAPISFEIVTTGGGQKGLAERKQTH